MKLEDWKEKEDVMNWEAISECEFTDLSYPNRDTMDDQMSYAKYEDKIFLKVAYKSPRDGLIEHYIIFNLQEILPFFLAAVNELPLPTISWECYIESLQVKKSWIEKLNPTLRVRHSYDYIHLAEVIDSKVGIVVSVKQIEYQLPKLRSLL